MTERTLNASPERVPCLIPKNYKKLSFRLTTILLSPLILLKIIVLIIIFAYLFIHCSLCVYIFPNNPNLYDNFFLPVFQFFTRFVLFLIGFYRIRIKDERRLKRDKAIIITNHISTFDFMVIFNKFGGVPLTKAELYRHPFLFIFPRFLKMIPVERDLKTGRSQAFEMLKHKINEIYPSEDNEKETKSHINTENINLSKDSRTSILINPEMSITDGSTMLSFATGAFRFKKPVYPVLVDYKGRNREVIMRFCESDVWSIIDLLSCFHFECEVRLLEEYEPNINEQNNPRFYADNVRAYMSREYNCEVSKYKYADSLIYWSGFIEDEITGEYYNVFDKGYYSFVDLKEKYEDLEYKTVIRIVKEFVKIKKNNLVEYEGDIRDYLLKQLNKLN